MTVAAERPAPASARRTRVRPAVAEAAALLVAAAATVPALAPLAAPGIAATHDGFLHVQRLIALDAAVRQGAALTRWLPDLAYGYGQPLLLYYAPLAYLPVLAARWLGAGFASSVEIAGALAIVGSALTMYLLVRALAGRLAAVTAAVVYATLPYQLVDLYVRGALAESWAFVWLPLLAWFLVRAWTDGRARWSIGLALGLAGLVLTHNVTALLFVPALAALALVLWLAHSSDLTDPRSPRRLARPAFGFALGLALSAGFWLPALAERSLVQIGETLEPELFASFFIRSWPPFQLDPRFSYEAPVSTALGSPIYWPQLGIVQVVVTLAGGLVVVGARGPLRAVAVWALLLVAGGIVLQLGPAAPLYDLIPLLAFVQFPWRLLALVGLGSAVLAGLLVERAASVTPGRPWHSALSPAVAAVVVGASLTSALWLLDPATTPVDERTLTPDAVLRAELADHGLGTTHSGEYLPVTSGQRNAARFRKTLLDDPSGRPNRSSAEPLAVRVERAEWRPDRVRLELDAASPDRLVLHQFAFPGWQAMLDGQAVALTQADPLGLLAVDVPAGRHVLEVAWGWTVPRGLALGISAAALLALPALGSTVSARPQKRLPGWLGEPPPPAPPPCAGAGAPRASKPRGYFWGAVLRRRAPLAWSILVVLGALVLAVLVGLNGLLRGAGGSETDRWQPVDDRLVLVDVEHDTSRLPGERVLVSRLLWQVREAPGSGYRASLEVMADGGRVHRAPWPYEPLSRHWQRGELVPTTVAVRLPPDFPAGPAELRLAFDQPAGLAPLNVGRLLVPPAFDSAPNAVGHSGGVGPEVVPGLSLAVLQPSTEPSSGARTARAGQALDLALTWTALQSAPLLDRELIVVAALQGPGGEILSEPGRPGEWFNPLPFWQTGDRIEQRLRLRLPPGIAAGTYPLAVRVYGRDLAHGGLNESGASSARPRGRPLAEVSAGELAVTP